MKFKVIDSYEEISQTVAREIADLIRTKPTASICIAAGHSSLGVLRILTDMYRAKELDFSQSYFIAMDEWKNMNVHDSGSCGDFLWKNFLSLVNFPEDHIMLPDGRACPIEDELHRIKSYIEDHGGIDYMVLGIGMNGHLALNEPGSPFDSTVRVTVLDSTTKHVGQKYFEGTPTLTGGVTIGLKDICDTRKLALVINGEHKATITKTLYDTPATPDIPASVLKTIDHCTVYCDAAAGALLPREN